MWQPQTIGAAYRLKWPFMYAKSSLTLKDIELNSIDSNHYFEKNFYNPNLNLNPEMTLTFLGDFMGVGAKNIELGHKLKNRFQTSTKIIINLESVVTDSNDLQLFKQHTSKNSFDNFLKDYGSDKIIFGLANNHIDDYGNSGVEKTINAISESGHKYFGLSDCPKLQLANGLDLWGQTHWMSGKKTSANSNLYNQNIDSENQFIEFIHWGNEFSDQPQKNQQKYFDQSRSLLTIGHHSHTPQKIIASLDRLCAFGLGNFTASVDSKRINFGQVLSIRLRYVGKWVPVFAQWKFLKINVNNKTVLVEEM